MTSVAAPAEFTLSRQPTIRTRGPVRWIWSHARRYWHVLLIMFIMVIPIATHALQVPLPTGHATEEIRDVNVVTIDAQDRLYWNGAELDRQELLNQLAAAAALPDEPVLRFLGTCLLEAAVPAPLARRAAWLRTAAGRGSAADALTVALAEPGGSILAGDRAANVEALALFADGVFVERV